MAKRWTHQCDHNCDRMRLRLVHEHDHKVFQAERRAKLRGRRPHVRATTRGLRFVAPSSSVQVVFPRGER